MRSPRTTLVVLLLALTAGCAPALFVKTRPDASLYHEPPASAITFWGHASVYIDVDGYGIVTDPVFGARYSPFNGRRIPTPPPEAYDQTRLILISHAHQDHLQPSTIARFSAASTILCPAPSEKYVVGLGPHVRVMRPGDVYEFPGGSVVAVVADHPGGRWSTTPHADGGALGYVIRTAKRTIYYSGDTEYFDGFAKIGAEFKPDVAILNVNAHLKPADALRAEEALGCPRVIASHEGAYGGRAGTKGLRWHDEFLGLAGGLAAPLRVGESVALDSLTPRAIPAGLDPGALIALAGSGPGSVSRFAEVEPGLYRGASPGTAGLRRLRDSGVRTIVSLIHDEGERREADALGLRYVEIPLHAGVFGSTAPTPAEIRTFLTLASDSSNRPLYFHCRHGHDRTGAMAAIYRIEVDRWSAADAIAEMRALGASRFYKDLYRPIYRMRDGEEVASVSREARPARAAR
ncbi:MAG: MBL fold metallo-hydrolase [Bacteroidota bacterium]